MMTNTYAPYFGGVDKSIRTFTQCFREKGHQVLIVAPKADQDYKEEGVVRVSAIKNFNDIGFPATLPLPGSLHKHIEKFQPEIVHSHFPFLIGSTAMRIAARYDLPLVFTYHTMYERYIHNVNLTSDRVRQFVITFTKGYANLCDQVIAPSNSVADVLRKRGVKTPITVIPTGVDTDKYAQGDGARFRQQVGLDPDDFVVGHVGRLAEEKNLKFLCQSAKKFLQAKPDAKLLIVGDGPSRKNLESLFDGTDVADRAVFAGMKSDQDLIDSYHAADVFAFSSLTETQGMVLAEAMAAGCPVVALKAPGVNDVLEHGSNGYLLEEDSDCDRFARMLSKYHDLSEDEKGSMRSAARQTAEDYSMNNCSDKMLAEYESVLSHKRRDPEKRERNWTLLLESLKAEWDLFLKYANAAGEMFSSHATVEER
ncbi:GDP-mannose-dependent alpha-mannosyltransferase [Anaerohalosphaera lusitana]|uniref:GDP-mannose-dependent alpha-mannosyltransferase n=1 Tax=Anaerohalosphaera lusitana TaxID=1936003 RepID=A0A1U9NQF0_9BACT|nr:glycosyltransferase [Anaerohalosphaera lusitana]AQT70139.1 GDP-mannose-dependent alpha-mannosyltransferase [Anaerohalosphaera lusitana]